MNMRRFSIGLAVVVSLGLGAVPAARAAASEAKVRDIRKLTALMGADKMAEQLVDQLMAALRQNYPKVSDVQWKRLRAKANVKAFLNEVIAVYDRHLTHPDVKQLMAFFESAVGRKFVALQPQLLQESIEIGNRWAESFAGQISKELDKGDSPGPAKGKK